MKTWEAKAYRNKKEFDNRQAISIIDGLSKTGAFAEAGMALMDYEIVKVQSSDREEIIILGHIA